MSSYSNVIAARYVSALFDMAAEAKLHDNVKKDLLTVKDMLSGSEELQKFLNNPVVTRLQAEKAISALLTAAKASDLTQRFFTLLARSRRLSLTSQIIDKYLARLAESRDELPVKVTTASALDKKQADTLAQAIAKATGKKVELQLSENPDLIGGMQVRIGSKLLDNSISGKLARLRLALKKAA
ncbi:MAG TPA: ATP synthase F1 subunit delta [Rickettsiales bacterium]|nr:ATP synthase F1 subunit delta [Rickettsiales bacterium]